MTASKPEIEEGVHILLKRGWTPYDVLTKALVEGMRIVGEDFRDGILFVPEVLLSANAMKAGMAILRPLLAETGAPKIGKMVIGTVKGDIHDIGKNLVSHDDGGRRLRGHRPRHQQRRSRNTSPRSRSTSPTSSACRRCSPRPCPT